MSSFALDHHVARSEVRVRPAGQWSSRRRLATLVACILASWAAVLAPLFIWL